VVGVVTEPLTPAWFKDLPPGPDSLLFFPCLWDLALTQPEGEPEAYVVWYDADWRVLGSDNVWRALEIAFGYAFIWETKAPGTDADRVEYAFLLGARDFTGRLARITQKLSDAQWIAFAPNGGGWL
jgi:hypothetical protein